MDIRQVQLLLNYLRYDTGGIEGICGPKTEQAVRDFQRDFGGLTSDGDPGPETQKKLIQAVSEGWQRQEGSGAPSGSGAGSGAASGTIWNRSPYFTRAEFACRCRQYHSPYCDGFPAEPDETLVLLANRVREHFGRPAYATSGLRCPRHNRDSGGVQNSRHLQGKALDYFIEGRRAPEVLAYLQTQPEVRYAYAVDDQVVHMDVA